MNETECQFEELVSAQLDGELSQAEQTRLRAHLAECGSCQQMTMRFRSLETCLLGDRDSMPMLPARKSEIHGLPGWRGHSVFGKHEHQVQHSRTRWKQGAILAGGTAVALAGLAAAVALSQRPANPGRIADAPARQSVPPIQTVVAPLSRLALSNNMSRRQQESLVRTLEFQLRALKLEMRTSGNPDSIRANEIEAEIDSLIDKMKQQFSAPAEDAAVKSPAL